MKLTTLLDEKILVGDGAMGTELLRLGTPTDTPFDLLNLEQPDLIKQVHESYVNAGSDLIITNTFGGTNIKLNKAGCEDKADQVNRTGAQLARQTVKGEVLVAGDIGPCGEMLKPLGNADPEVVLEAFSRQARALADGGADLLILETFFDLAEALLAAKAAVATGLPIIASMTFSPKRGGIYTMMGNAAEDCAKALADAGAVVVGANCTVTIEHMPAIAAALRKGTSLPLMLQPNAGQPEVVEGKTLYKETPDHFASMAPALVEAGARIIGGCCGTDPRFITAIRQALDGAN